MLKKKLIWEWRHCFRKTLLPWTDAKKNFIINSWKYSWKNVYCYRNQFSLVTQSCLTLCDPWTAARQASLFITNSWSLPKLISIESVVPSNHLILCCPLLLLPSILPSIRVFPSLSQHPVSQFFTSGGQSIGSFSLSISPSNEYSGLISFRIDRLDLFAVQEILKSHLQHHSSKTSILWHSAFFTVQLSHPYMDYCKNHSFDQMDLCWQS